MGRLALEELYPFYENDIARLRSEGADDVDILDQIQEGISAIRAQGFTAEEAGRQVSERIEPPRPGLSERFFKSAAREATFGLFQPNLPEPVGVAEALADITGIVPGFIIPGGIARAGARAIVPRLVARAGLSALVSPGARALAQGVTEAGIFTGLSTAGTAISRREIPDPAETLESFIINSALFGLGELVPLMKTARGIAKGTDIPLADIERQLLFRSPGKIDFGTPDFTRLSLESMGLLPPQGSIENPVPVLVNRLGEGPFEPGGESRISGRDPVGTIVEPILREPATEQRIIMGARTGEAIPFEDLQAAAEALQVPETGFARRPAPPEAQRVLPARAGGPIPAPGRVGAQPALPGGRAIEGAGRIGAQKALPEGRINFLETEGQFELNLDLPVRDIVEIRVDLETVMSRPAAEAQMAKAARTARATVKQEGLFDRLVIRRLQQRVRRAREKLRRETPLEPADFEAAGRETIARDRIVTDKLRETAELRRSKGKVKTPKTETAEAVATDFNEIAGDATFHGEEGFRSFRERTGDVSEVSRAKGPRRTITEETFIDRTQLVERPDSLARLREVAAPFGFTVVFERTAKGVQGFLEGKVGRKQIKQPFNDAASAVRDIFTGENIFGEPLPMTKTELVDRITQYQAASQFAEPAPGTFRGKSKLDCASPCVPDPEGKRFNTAVEDAQIAAALRGTEAGIQATESLRKSIPLVDKVRDLKTAFTEKPWLTNFLSPSFYLEKFPLGKEIIKIVDRQSLALERFLNSSIDRVFGARKGDIGKRRGGLADLDIREGSIASVAVGYLLENPDAAARFPQRIQRATGIFRKEFDKLYREMHNIDPNIAVGRIKNYLPHIFEPELLRAELIKEIDALKADAGGLSAGRASQLEATLESLDRGGPTLYEALPSSLRSRFFETRKGRSGYRFDATKAYMTYVGNVGRKIHFDGVVREFTPRIGELPEGVQGLAREYLRDVTGVKDRIPDQIASVAARVRELQFLRTIGFNPLTATKNMFQQLFIGAELGVRHLTTGWRLARTAEGKSVFAASGHALDVPDIFLRSGKRTAYTPGWKRAVEIGGWMFNKVETTNRHVAYMGGLSKWFEGNANRIGMTLEEGLRKGFEFLPLEAKDFANDSVRKTQFRYGKVDLPLLLRDPVIGTALQFSSFGIKASELMWKWAFREGRAGRAKLLTFLSVSGGVATLGALAGFPTLGDGVASPINVVEMFDVLGGMAEGDWVRAKAAAKNTLDVADFGISFGPTAGLVFDAGKLANKFVEGQQVDEAVKQFGARNLLPVPVRRFTQAWREFEAGGNAGDFIASFFGLPTSDAIVRREAIRLLERGQLNSFNDLVNEYRRINGGSLPANFLNPQVRAALLAQGKVQTRESRQRLEAETPRQRQIRRLRGTPERVFRNPIVRKTGVV